MNDVRPEVDLPESEPIPDAEYDETAGEDDDDLDIPADVETEGNPLRDPETGEPLPADEPDDLDG